MLWFKIIILIWLKNIWCYFIYIILRKIKTNHLFFSYNFIVVSHFNLKEKQSVPVYRDSVNSLGVFQFYIVFCSYHKQQVTLLCSAWSFCWFLFFFFKKMVLIVQDCLSVNTWFRRGAFALHSFFSEYCYNLTLHQGRGQEAQHFMPTPQWISMEVNKKTVDHNMITMFLLKQKLVML